MDIELIKQKLSKTFAWDLLGESGSPEEGRKELIDVVVDILNSKPKQPSDDIKILAQDDASPDSFEAFKSKFVILVGEEFDAWKKKAIKRISAKSTIYTRNGYKAVISEDDPHWTVYI